MDCDSSVHDKATELMMLSNNIGKQLAMKDWVKDEVTNCIMMVEDEYMSILANRMAELPAAEQ